ncbi:glutamine-hydrolyzing carbamoyl-phosphate synthase small subunit [Nonlabens ponticola]|uniref:Carbamoyl phosphate synthase small chain n=1 Tax=Nonlabens ponticola TaxID=2496866 RepID=A0A3S9N0A9_9FLAO|nr:glutamine-hydrolyzing carbamoyl-phosphate synthase small subunit [Nonlabens ponticola]AZQ44975.1 carbamoyl-phosphate synthase small subunit [Nonlabens ponticola]
MAYLEKKDAIILLQDGTIFHGKMVSTQNHATGEICFNTGTTGYQEIFTDPSYYGQIMVTTNAHIGNYGTTDFDIESDSVKIAGLVCKNFSSDFSRPAADKGLFEFLEDNNLCIISDVDTRALVSHIRDHGAQNAIMSTQVNDVDQLKKQLNDTPSMKGLELASAVSTKEPYYFGDENAQYRIAALDLGVKTNILRNLASRDCYIKVFPFNATYEETLSFNPDGYFISNGPGDPAPLVDAVAFAKAVLEKQHPLFGICLGHQVIALANGISTYKMHTGHRGINHPVQNLENNKGEITSQNHGFAINKEEAQSNPDVKITHMHLNDDTVAGIKLISKPCFSVQYHPEAGPGPNDATYLFDQFIELINTTKQETI